MNAVSRPLAGANISNLIQQWMETSLCNQAGLLARQDAGFRINYEFETVSILFSQPVNRWECIVCSHSECQQGIAFSSFRFQLTPLWHAARKVLFVKGVHHVNRYSSFALNIHPRHPLSFVTSFASFHSLSAVITHNFALHKQCISTTTFMMIASGNQTACHSG